MLPTVYYALALQEQHAEESKPKAAQPEDAINK